MTLLIAFFAYAYWKKIVSFSVAFFIFVFMSSVFAAIYLARFCLSNRDGIAAKARAYEKNPAQAFSSEMKCWRNTLVLCGRIMQAHMRIHKPASDSGTKRCSSTKPPVRPSCAKVVPIRKIAPISKT